MNSDWADRIDWVEVASLLSWTAFLLFVVFSGRLPLYINPRFAFIPLTGALITLAMAIRVIASPNPDIYAPKRHTRVLTWFLMPIALAIVVSPAGMGAFAVDNSAASRTRANTSITFNPGVSGYKRTTLVRLAEAGNIKEGKVSVEGQVKIDPKLLDSNEILLYHYQMVCCVLHVSPVSALVKHPADYEPAAGQWVRVKGTVKRDDRGVVISADAITPIKEPDPPYIY